MSVSQQSRKDHSDGSDGSDSDATTTSSTEHLTREEKLYVLRHTARQEPQGQESKSWQQLQQQRQSRPSCRSCSGLQLAQHQQHQQRSSSVNPLEQSMNSSGGGPDPASSCRTLIIHGSLSDESWARLAGTGSIPDLGLAGSHYLTSTPKTPPFRPASSDCNDDAEDLLLLGSADRRRRRGGGHPPPPPPSPGVGGFTTRSLPRSAKDFSALSTYQRHHPSSQTSLASLYHEEQENTELDHHNGCCERRKQLKMLQGLAREMNWSLPITTTTTTAPGPSDSCYPLSIEESGDGACSALSISDTLLNDHQTMQTPSSYTRDFTYLSKPPPAYPRNKSFGSGTAPATTTAAVTTENAALNGGSSSSRNSSSSSSCRRIKIRRALSRSHPDLSKLGKELGWNKSSAGTSDSSNTWRALRHNKTEPATSTEEFNTQNEKTQIDPPVEIPSMLAEAAGPAAIAISGDNVMVVKPKDSEAVWSTPELVDAILEENFKLRQQVQNHQDHIAKLQKFEKELSAVQSAHQALVRSSERKESLEKSARIRLEAEWRRAQEMSAALRNQVELLTSQLALRSASVASLGNVAESASTADWQNQIARRASSDVLIAQLVSQNKELMTNKERQDIELCAQKATLQQQRSHIEILESALGRAQQNVNRLEDDEFRRRCNGDSRHLLASAGVESNATAQAEPAAHREMANMEIRIRDLEAKLSEKEMLIHLLQRASMDREIAFGATRGLPESVSLLNRYPSQQQQSSQPPLESHLAMNLATTTNGVKGAWSGSSGVSSLPSSSRGSAISVASNNSSSRNKALTSSANAPNTSAASEANPSVTSQNNNAETAQSLDNQLRALDRFYQNKQSLIQALQSDKERFPNNYWPS